MSASELLCQPQDVLDAWPAFGNLSATRQTSLINTASQKILNFCRHGFAQTMHDEFHDGRNTSNIWVNARPIIQVAAIIVNGNPLDNSDPTSPAWTIYPGEGKIVRGPSVGVARFNWWFPMGTRNIEVIYYAGFASVPDPIVQATVFMVKYLQDQVKVTGIYASESIGDYSYNLNANASVLTLPAHVADLCADYVQDDGPVF
jgi:hypothetical protein